MNQFGNRGYGGPPQPQRQGGRRGNNRGGFRNSRFEHNNQNERNQNHGQGGQRPNIEPVKQVVPEKQPPPTTQQPKEKPNEEVQQAPAAASTPAPPQVQQQNNRPQQQSQRPQQNQRGPQQGQQQNQRPQNQQQPQQSPQQQPQQQQLNQQQQQKLNQSKSQDDVDKSIGSEKNTQGPSPNQNQFHKNINGNFGGGNKAGGTWSQGGPGNRQNQNQNQKQFGPKQQGVGGGPARNQRHSMRGQPDGKAVQREDHFLLNKLKELGGPLIDLPQIDQTELKFNGRSRLYIGNLTSDVTEEEIMNLFGQFGEAAELFLNKEKNFGFIKMDYRVNAEKAKRELDGKMRNGRSLRVRFAPHNCAVRVKNLPPFVSNELLFKAFEIFGKIERAYVRVDERGKTLGEGVVEFARKPSALSAIRNCTEKCFFLTSSLRPVIVESYEEPDEFDGYPEKNLPKKHPEFLRAREVGPRFSEPNSFEHEYGTRWKQLHELHRQKEEALKKELAAEEEKLEAQMEYAKYEHETELLREQLRQREQDRERQKRSWEMAERAADERREAERAQLLRQEEELSQRMRLQDDELRRRQQENTLFVQAQRLNSMLDRQEQGMFDQQQPMEGGFREQYDMPRGGYDDMPPQTRGWDGPRHMDDYPNKRRRF
ncbi:Hrp65 protein [Papilio xuthus]|uniref:Hrp65 protein n=1 Tax=Papilio xuthus TaxID=66420 RepID=A0A194Q021_PAPXU|nr:Hrp65 protein [Papilio xuthus]